MKTNVISKIFPSVLVFLGLIVFDAKNIKTAPSEVNPNIDDLGLSNRGGIREEIPAKFAKRYEKWKRELLSTEIGREQWESYRQDQNFRLTITIDIQRGRGGATGSFEWDERGRLIAATIALGPSLNEGFPEPAFYPVTSSLQNLSWLDGNILAATKLAHELGHIERTRMQDGSDYRRQFELIQAFNTILLTNGYADGRPQLLEMAREMGGTPVEISEFREYWAEVNAMRFLNQRITNKSPHEELVKEITHNIKKHATFFTKRFDWPTDVIVNRIAAR